jgi:hypothetical protein
VRENVLLVGNGARSQDGRRGRWCEEVCTLYTLMKSPFGMFGSPSPLPSPPGAGEAAARAFVILHVSGRLC